MNYELIYKSLCSRGQQDRQLEFKENHHIIPRCMGGNDLEENLTNLTPEEHFVAHQILLKLYPGVRGLASAAHMMTVSSECVARNNKEYGWLKKRWISECRSRPAEKNASFGSMWISNIEQKISKKIKKIDIIPEGWVLGRNTWNKITKCAGCNLKLITRMYCDVCLRDMRIANGKVKRLPKGYISGGAKWHLTATEEITG